MDTMADDPYERIAQLEAENAALREGEATLTHEVERLRPALAEALEQQAATAEILRSIATAPASLQAITDVIGANAARLCDSAEVAVQRLEADVNEMTLPKGAA